MADESFINRKDLEDVTQKVTIQNSKDIAKPLIDQQKNNDLKELERSIEQKALFQDIVDGITDLTDALIEGLKGLIPKDGGSGMSFILGGALTAALGTFDDIVRFFKRIFNRVKNAKLGKFISGIFKSLKTKFLNIGTMIKNSKLGAFIISIFDKIKNSKLLLFIGGIFDRIKNSKVMASVGALFTKVFGKGGFFSSVGGFFTKLKDIGKSGPFKSIAKIGGKLLGLLGKIFLPITILLGVIDFYKGFMKGYEEGGIIEGIKQGIQQVFDGLIGGLLRILAWIPAKLAELLGLNKLSKAIGEFTETFIQSVKDVFGGLVDIIVGIITFDGKKIKKGFTLIWEGIINFAKSFFNMLSDGIEDIFGIKIKDFIKPIGNAFDNMVKWFSDLGDSLGNIFTMDTLRTIGRNLYNAALMMMPVGDSIRDFLKKEDPNSGATGALMLSPRQQQALDDLNGGLPGGGSFRGGDTRVTNSSPTIINNTINAPSNNGINALRAAMG